MIDTFTDRSEGEDASLEARKEHVLRAKRLTDEAELGLKQHIEREREQHKWEMQRLKWEERWDNMGGPTRAELLRKEEQDTDARDKKIVDGRLRAHAQKDRMDLERDAEVKAGSERQSSRKAKGGKRGLFSVFRSR